MKELKCPKCGGLFTVDEADYASIAAQVRGAEFNEELERRLAELHSRAEAEGKLREADLRKGYEEALFKKERAIGLKEQEIALLIFHIFQGLLHGHALIGQTPGRLKPPHQRDGGTDSDRQHAGHDNVFCFL